MNPAMSTYELGLALARRDAETSGYGESSSGSGLGYYVIIAVWGLVLAVPVTFVYLLTRKGAR